MATENTLRLRSIRPRVPTAASIATPNEWRRATSADAKTARVSRRRFVRMLRKAANR